MIHKRRQKVFWFWTIHITFMNVFIIALAKNTGMLLLDVTIKWERGKLLGQL